MSPTANFSYPTAIRFGAGRIAELAEACRAAGINRPLLVIDRGLAGLEVTARALDVLEGAGLGGGVVIEHGGLVHVAPQKADGLTVLEVDGGIEDHRL